MAFQQGLELVPVDHSLSSARLVPRPAAVTSPPLTQEEVRPGEGPTKRLRAHHVAGSGGRGPCLGQCPRAGSHLGLSGGNATGASSRGLAVLSCPSPDGETGKRDG